VEGSGPNLILGTVTAGRRIHSVIVMMAMVMVISNNGTLQ
jgi:hypothetical protein